MKLSLKQRQALEMLREPGQDGESKTAEVTSEETCSDSFGVWVNHQTAKALERRGLVRIARDEDWTIYLADHIDGPKRPPPLPPDERKKRADSRDRGELNDGQADG